MPKTSLIETQDHTTEPLSVRLEKSIKSEVMKIATMQNRSVSSIVTEVLREFVTNHSEEISYFDKVFDEEGRVRMPCQEKTSF